MLYILRSLQVFNNNQLFLNLGLKFLYLKYCLTQNINLYHKTKNPFISNALHINNKLKQMNKEFEKVQFPS